MTALLRAEGLWVEGDCHGRRQTLLRAVDLELMAGRVTALLGASGAGKTILARAFCGLLPDGFCVSRGSITFRGKCLGNDADWAKLRGRKIFYAPQNAAASLNPVLTIGRQIMETSRLNGEQLLELLGALRFAAPRRILASYPFMLSGGESQRCLLAMALAGGAELLILDEPTAELDAAAQVEFIRVLRACRRLYALTVLLISHQLDLMADIAEYLCVMHAGTIVDAGTFAAVLAAPGHAVTREIAAYLESF